MTPISVLHPCTLESAPRANPLSFGLMDCCSV